MQNPLVIYPFESHMKSKRIDDNPKILASIISKKHKILEKEELYDFVCKLMNRRAKWYWLFHFINIDQKASNINSCHWGYWSLHTRYNAFSLLPCTCSKDLFPIFLCPASWAWFPSCLRTPFFHASSEEDWQDRHFFLPFSSWCDQLPSFLVSFESISHRTQLSCFQLLIDTVFAFEGSLLQSYHLLLSFLWLGSQQDVFWCTWF